MKKLLLILALTAPAMAATLSPPTFTTVSGTFADADGIVDNFYSIGATPSWNVATTIPLIPGNIAAVVISGATPNVICYTTDGTTPTATTPGTCSHGITFTYGVSTSPIFNGSGTLEAISTAVGSTNSSVMTSTITIGPFSYPGAAANVTLGNYSYTVPLVLYGTQNGNLIYTTDTTTPTADGSCNATNGTAATNGTTINITTTTTVKLIGCVGGTTTSVNSSVYTITSPTTWYVLPGGGNRTQCTGTTNAVYPGSGSGQACGFSDFRYLWSPNDGTGYNGTWVISGGDTVKVTGCTAGAGQTNPDNPTCRLGWDSNSNGNPPNQWCPDIGNAGCYNPSIPWGDAAHHTEIYGTNYASCNTGGATNPKTYVGQLAQLFGGMGMNYTFNLTGTQYVDVSCIELTTHNAYTSPGAGQCTRHGSPSYPQACNNNPTLSDYADNGFYLSNTSQNITLTDVYAHGFAGCGIQGPTGNITLLRVFVGFNGFCGWDMDDGVSTPDAPNTTINANYVTMIGNGCYEEYPIVHAFPARACYDDVSNGFGDAWSGQDTKIAEWLCNHCTQADNTKDATIGPHTIPTTLIYENGQSYGNMGAQLKYISGVGTSGSPVTMQILNNFINGNCARFEDPSVPIPGASQVFGIASGLGGAYLSDYCRAGGNTNANNIQQYSNVIYGGNTFTGNYGIFIYMDCGPSANTTDGLCATSNVYFIDNAFLGYYNSGGDPPALFVINDPTITITPSYNVEYALKGSTGETCGTNGNICVDPLFVNEPIQQAWTNQYFLDNFNFYLTSGSPALLAGTTYSGQPSINSDQCPPSVSQTSPPWIGACYDNYTGGSTMFKFNLKIGGAFLIEP